MSISTERLEELTAGWENQYKLALEIEGQTEYANTCHDTAEALRELQLLHKAHREIICTRSGRREQLGRLEPVEF